MILSAVVDRSICAGCDKIRASNCLVHDDEQPLGIDSVCPECCPHPDCQHNGDGHHAGETR